MARRIPGLKRSNTQTAYTQEQMFELYRCSVDPVYFIENYIMIRHAVRGKIKFKMYDYQRELVRRYHRNRFNIILSARQTGKTETSCAFLLWMAIFHPDKTILVASNKSANAMEIIGKIQYAYEELPEWLKPGIDDSSWNKHTVGFDNKSRIVACSTSKDSGRGMAISLIYVDEMAFVAPHIQVEFWDSITPTISTGGSMIITSTPNGDSNLFAKTWFNSIKKTAEELNSESFHPMHVKWDQPPGRDGKFRAMMIDKLGERKWRQEFECEFISSDHTLFDSYLVSEAERDYDRKVGEITAGDLNKEEEDYVPSYPFKYANTVMWKNIERGKTYIVGVDPATGSGLDYTVFQVFEFPSLFQVMEYRSNTMSSPVAYVQLKNLLKFIERHTQEVYFSIENNGVGNGMISLYEADEDNPPKAHMVSDRKGTQNGMNTTAFTKMTSALKFKELFERRQMVLNSKILMHEMKNYVRKDGSYAANTNVNDDCISAILMVLRIIEEMASYDDTAYSRIYNVDAQIEMEGRWDYNENDFINSVSRRNEVEEEWDENDMPMPMLI